MAGLKLKNLVKSYGTNRILHGISLDVKPGELVSLLGPSGCGKTTTLRCIAGLERPDAQGGGEITLDGQMLSGPGVFVKPEDRQFGMVFQSYAVWPHMNVFDNVAFPLNVKGSVSKADLNKRVLEALSRVHLQGYEKRFGHELSGGQLQRVALARAIAMSPKLLLLDEPLSNLDALLREELRAEIQRLQKELKITTILVTHDQKEALSLSDRIVVLNKGHIEAIGTPEELYSRPPTEFVAQFLVGGQTVKTVSGESRQFVPRRWQTGASSGGKQVKIISRLYLGDEYEYWAQSSELADPIKFFSDKAFEPGSEIQADYK